MNNRKTLVTIGALLIAAVTLSVAAFGNSQMCCMGKREKSGKQEVPAQATQQGDTQTATYESASD